MPRPVARGSDYWQAWRRYRSCGKKRRYESENAAKCAANSISGNIGVRIDHYFCTFCNYWHIGQRRNAEPVKPQKQKKKAWYYGGKGRARPRTSIVIHDKHS